MVVTRLFQAKKDANSYDRKKFAEVAVPYRTILKSSTVASLIVVVAGGGPFAEVPDNDGILPTIQVLNEEFRTEILSGRVRSVRCDNWGPNVGSPFALNAGMDAARADGARFIMNWSPELDITPEWIAVGHAHMESRGLDACGFVREGWFNNTKQYLVPQNTGVIYRAALLDLVQGFDAYTSGEHGETLNVTVDGVDVAVPIAGMEDYYYILELMKVMPYLRLGMVGRSSPLPWNVWKKLAEWKINNPLEYARQTQKIARQPLVMDVYAKRLFPDRNPEDVTSEVMRRIALD